METVAKESLSFSRLDAWRRFRKLRDQYGGEQGLSKVSGISVLQIRKYCSEKYMKEHNFQQATWEKYFGPWDNAEPTFVLLCQKNAEETASTVEDNTNDQKTVDKETDKPVSEIKMPRLILEVPSLEELDATLELYGMKLIIE